MKLLGYLPDADYQADGVITDCANVVPTIRGIGGAPSAITTNNAALAATCIGAASIVKLDSSTRTFAGTATKLYELSSATWTDQSAGGGSYTTVNNRWRFAQYGNITLATSKENPLQFSTTAAFAKVVKTAVDAPKADIVEVVNDFVFLANTNSGPTYSSDDTNRWWCSAIGDYTDWTPAIATQCASGLLASSPGKITACRKFGDQVVIYKEQAMYLGSYAGPPIIWAFPELPTAKTGTWTQESVISIGTPESPLHFFVGPDDFYLFDGARPVSVGLGVKETFFTNLNIASAAKICMLHNRPRSLVYVFYPRGSSLITNACLVFNYRTKKWGQDDRSIEYPFEYINPGINYNSVGTTYSTYDDLPSASYDTAFAESSRVFPAFFDLSHKIYSLTGGSQSATITTGDFGNDSMITNVSRVTPKFLTPPTGSAALVNLYRASSGSPLIGDAYTTMSSLNRFDLLRSASWHRLQFTFYGDWELNSVMVDMKQDGRE